MSALSPGRLGHALLAVVGFLVVAAGVRTLVPLPENQQLAARFRHLEAHGAEYDLVFVGSSTVRRAFVPDAFDAELARRGHHVRSFNLGIPGAWAFEVDHVVRRLLALPTLRPRWIVIEPMNRDPGRLIPRENRFTDRVVYWHTGIQTRDVLLAMWRDSRRGFHYLPAAGDHIRHALWRLANLGQGDRIVASRLRPPAPDDLAARGFEPLDVEEGGAGWNLRDDPEGWRALLASVERLDAGRPGHVPLEWKVRRQVRMLRSAGVEPVYVLTPAVAQTTATLALARRGVIPTLLAFNSPSRFPELYDWDNRQDLLHLNPRGAERFSRIFAEHFAAWLDAKGAR